MSPKKSDTVTKVNVEEIRGKLIALRDEILKEASGHLIIPNKSVKGDLVDQSTDLSEKELMLSLAESDRKKLQHIEAALKMMKENTYGECHSCGGYTNPEAASGSYRSILRALQAAN